MPQAQLPEMPDSELMARILRSLSQWHGVVRLMDLYQQFGLEELDAVKAAIRYGISRQWIVATDFYVALTPAGEVVATQMANHSRSIE